jgi:thymidylate kinase
MKHIIIEGGDRLGKDTLIKNLCNHFQYRNVTIRHFDKPPKGMNPKETLDFQFSVFYKEFEFARQMHEFLDLDSYGYHENIIIWNRAHLGEYVYSQMFRGVSRRDVASRIKTLEERNLRDNQYLITLTASPKFFLDQEDGESFSQNLDQKTKELQLFKEIHALSLIEHKKLIKVNEGSNYRGKEEIFNEVLKFINE